MICSFQVRILASVVPTQQQQVDRMWICKNCRKGPTNDSHLFRGAISGVMKQCRERERERETKLTECRCARNTFLVSHTHAHLWPVIVSVVVGIDMITLTRGGHFLSLDPLQQLTRTHSVCPTQKHKRQLLRSTTWGVRASTATTTVRKKKCIKLELSRSY